MLRKIKIANSSGIYEPIEIDLVKGNYGYNKQFIYEDKVISPAVIYGLNGSGKTSVLRSFKNLIEVFNSDLTDGVVYGMPNEFYGKNENTKIELEIELESIKYHYQIEICDKNKIVSEEVEITKESEDGYETRRLTRDDYFIDSMGVEEWKRVKALLEEYKSDSSNGDLLKKVDSYIIKESTLVNKLKDNQSFVRELGKEEKNADITRLYLYLKNISFVSTDKEIASASLIESWGTILKRNNKKLNEVANMFEEIMPLEFGIDKGAKSEQIYAMYDVEGESYKLDYKTMLSSGTRDFYRMLAAILEMPEGSLLVIDEVEKTFHPNFLKRVIELIAEKSKVQLVTSSHNTSLMKSLRPDQIYFTKKNDNRIELERLSKMYPKIREIHNIEKMYCSGRFD